MKKKIATILTAAVIGATAFTTIVSAASGDITVVSREDGSGTRGAFVELFGIEEEKDGEKVDMTTDEASVTNSTSVMMTTVAGDENAIGYISLGSLDDTVKAVKIDGVEATVDNVSNDSYKIARPFNILTSDKESDAAKDFVNYIMSSDGQKIVEANGYIKKYVAVLDPTKLNRGFVVFCSVKLRRLNRDIAAEFTRIVREIPEVTECYNISGDYDYLLKIHAPDMKYYQEFIINVLGTIESMGSLMSTFVMDEVKHEYGIPL